MISQRITLKFGNEAIKRFLKIIFFVYKERMEISRRTHESKNGVKSNKKKKRGKKEKQEQKYGKLVRVERNEENG